MKFLLDEKDLREIALRTEERLVPTKTEILKAYTSKYKTTMFNIIFNISPNLKGLIANEGMGHS